MHRWRVWVILGAVALLIPAAYVGADTEAGASEESAVDRWLMAGPASEVFPLFEERETLENSAWLLDDPVVPGDDLWPVSGAALEWRVGLSLTWREKAAIDGDVVLQPVNNGMSVVLLACYLESPRWQKVDLVIRSRNVLSVRLDGEEATRKNSPTPAGEEEAETVATLELPTGKSRLLVRTAVSPGDSLDEWRLNAVLRVPAARAGELPRVSLSPIHTFARLDDLSKMFQAGSAVLSPDGTHFVVARFRWIPETDRTEQVFEIRSAENGDLVQTLDLRAAASSPVWSPDGARLAVTVSGDKGTSDLWILDLEEGSFSKLLSAKKSLSDVAWSSGGEEIIFTAVDEDESDEESKYERITEPYMRWPGWKDRAHLWVVSISDRVERGLARGEFSVGQVTSCASRPLVAFVRTVPIEVRPYEKRELWTLDLETLEATRERDLRFAEMGDLTFGPDGETIAWVASPSETDTLPSSPDHNAYEQDLYVWDRADKTMLNLTDRFDPSVGADLYGAGRGGQRIWWNAADGLIYFTATSGGRNLLYCANPRRPEITNLPVDPSAVYGISGSGRAARLLFYGSSIDIPPRLYRYDLRRRNLQEILFPGEAVYSKIRFGESEPWNFVDSRGLAIEGWIYYPPGFDRTKTYPLIVYYYGGVFPNGEAFVWRNHYLAANHYVVYTLNPAGAVGYGPTFADAHVNDWGEQAAQDVIEGVQTLLADKPFIDAARVGAFGGSYGGFLTMQILTKTDLFAAAEASYGISNITSYWGEGRWGYLYGDVALARSYPWNRPDIFVDRSPLFHADKIRTPLLLTHGTGDTNVPSGESDQMFTALRVLRKDVVYVRFPGEEHGISGTQSIRAAHNEIRLEWFDKYLKDQPEAWENRWKSENGR